MTKTAFFSRTLVAALALCGTLAQAGDFVIQGDTVFDRNTELTWKRCSVGMRWAADRNRCVGVKRTFTFDDAKEVKAEGGWRVPSIDELNTLIEKRPTGQVQIDSNAFPDMENTLYYWSSTPSGASHGWDVLFTAGETSDYDRSNTRAVRLVRGGQ